MSVIGFRPSSETKRLQRVKAAQPTVKFPPFGVNELPIARIETNRRDSRARKIAERRDRAAPSYDVRLQECRVVQALDEGRYRCLQRVLVDGQAGQRGYWQRGRR